MSCKPVSKPATASGNSLRRRENPSVVLQDDRATLLNGDVLDLIECLPAASIDAVITDPPYCSGGTTFSDRMKDPAEKYCQGGDTLGRPSFAGDTRDQRSFKYWCALWLARCRRAAKEGAYGLVFIDWRQLPAMTDAFQAAGWTWRGIIAWDKGRCARAPHKGYFRHQCEYIVWGTNGWIPRPDDRGPFDGCIHQSVRRADKHHITGKPTELMRDLVRIVPDGGRVLDPFAGSATTGVAALLEGKRFTGFEYSTEYTAIGRLRLQAALKGQVLEVDR